MRIWALNLIQKSSHFKTIALHEDAEFKVSELFFSECTCYRLQHFFSSYGYIFELIFAF